MILYPDIYVSNVKNITYEMLQNYGIKGLILDVDNTLIDYYRNMQERNRRMVRRFKEKRNPDFLLCQIVIKKKK